MNKRILAVLAAGWITMVVACGGAKADAAKEYRLIYQDSSKAEKERILPRIVEGEIKGGNPDEAKRWIKRGLDDDNLKIIYIDPKLAFGI